LTTISSGTYTYTITNSYGCISSPSSNAVINSAPVIPSAPVITSSIQPTCPVPTGSISLSGLPATGTWTLTRSPGVSTISSGSAVTIAPLNPGTYSFTVTNSSGCTSTISLSTILQEVKTGVIPVLTRKWNDVLICYNLNNELTTWQWFKGNTPLTGETTDPFYWAKNQAGAYKVLTTDIDGCKNYSNIIQVSAGTKSLTAYPNPARENVTVTLNDDPVGKAVISIYNQTGTKVLEIKLEKEFSDLLKEIPVGSLDEGVYLVKVTVNQTNIYYTKIVVVK
jgi:hypothetical protein